MGFVLRGSAASPRALRALHQKAFQLAFISTHLPAYLSLCGMTASAGAMALAVIGLVNMIGSWACGWLGVRFPQQNVLGWIYLLRGLVTLAFFLAPKSEPVLLAGADMAGEGAVDEWAGGEGVRHAASRHALRPMLPQPQIGCFLGTWSGGLVIDITGSYRAVWVAIAIAGFVAAVLHFPIDDTRVQVAHAGAASQGTPRPHER
ncbi:MFS transporter [Plastoroseomonas hellenica]|uniref:hypothetical protein n=1 Tax=Plastoroseomonas hellenica TaxID=2687306 RepID=UPI001BA4761E|nr:hypothetical protein [Plastoroseomonas hellenica]